MEWLPIITTILGPLLAKCWGEQTERPQDFLARHYDSQRQRMEPVIVRRAMPQTRKAIAQAKRQMTRQQRKDMQKLSANDIYAITEQQLVAAMHADDSEVLGVFAVAAALKDDA